MRIKYILLILLQLLLLAGIVGYREYWVETGDKILLRTAPVDPRDLFRGDYVRLSYEISTLALDQLGVKGGNFKPGQVVYVGLEKNPDGTFKAVSVDTIQPWNQKFIQGRVRYESSNSRWEVSLMDDEGNTHTLKPQFFWGFKKGDRITFCLDNNNNVLRQFKEEASYREKCEAGKKSLSGTIEDIKETKFKSLLLEYDIESYFVEEGKGRALEAARNAKEVTVEVALRSDGKGLITALFVGGQVVK